MRDDRVDDGVFKLGLVKVYEYVDLLRLYQLDEAAQVRSASSPFSRPGQVLLKLRISI